ncbi:nuclear transport factor 2 family protein [Novosphingobium sp. Leaf2]|uniref:nuclear transport factor 2 family protein n=1 Tax=Novosphingobium sp. Leaf2 TaxID=1735670 RepID=UPI0006FB4ABE|nr:nuclear transport factor 2 family protein [Novosphingobium sp. Leaf2]KQM21076.1 hypothetical protein ASE49_15440 [Novosphingobium sp. Leaf2]
MTVEDLFAREAIRQLRIDYSTAFDTMDEALVRRICTDDIICHYPTEYGGLYHGVDTVLVLFRETWKHMRAPRETLHLIANHSIALTGPDSARGDCLLVDLVTRQHEGSAIATQGGHANPLLLLGHYEDQYVRQDGTWKFARIDLSLLWPTRS